MEPQDWSNLNNIQVGRYAEYYVKMEFTQYGFDVYGAEVDDHGVDFVVRTPQGVYLDIQVKSARSAQTGYHYVFARKEKFKLKENLYAAVVLFPNNKPPKLFLIPSMAWQKPSDLFCDRDYVGKKSKPEWGLNLSEKNMIELNQFEFGKCIKVLLRDRKSGVSKP